MLVRFRILTMFVIVALLTGTAAAQTAEPESPVTLYLPQIIAEIPHATDAFTQGFLLHEGRLFESTGRYGQSTLREIDPATGEVLRRVDVDEQYFAEGLALVDDRLIQLTWRAGVAFVYDLETFEQLDTFEYEGEGWGLCYDGEQLWMSDGTPTLFVRDAETFELLDTIPVTFMGQAVQRVNELECVGDTVWANVWQTDVILQISKATGEVVGVLDASTLLSAEGRALLEPGAVLNGIAYNPETETFLLTGKLWPSMFEVELVEVAASG